MRKFGLIGKPLTHSFSKKYFTEKFLRESRTDCAYELFPIESIESLPELIASSPNLEGLNVTIPYKEKVLPYLSTSLIPDGVGACNCIKISEGKLVGYNTDILGFEKTLFPLLLPTHKAALVFGSGGASKAVIYVLKKLGIHYQLVGRNKTAEVGLTYEDITEELIKRHLLLINTTPLGMYPNVDICPAIPYNAIGTGHLLYDLVYNPSETLFLKNGLMQGATIKNGEQMLIAQAEESWRIWNE